MNSKKNRLSEEVKNGVIYLNIGLTLIMVVIGSVYLISIGGSAQMGYSFTMKELEYNELKTQNENLKHQLLQVSALSKIKNDSARVFIMEPGQAEFYETRLDRLSKK
jgi:hypothetical protein